MTHNNDHLTFPSGRSVAAARADAKKRCRSKGIPLHQAQDDIVLENGLDLTWAQAMKYLSEQTPETTIPKGVFSCDSVTLLAIQKAAKAVRKTSGRPLADELLDACQRHGFDDPALAASALYVTVSQDEVHRLLVGPLLVKLNAHGNDLFIKGAIAPTKPTRDHVHFQEVVLGHPTIIQETEEGDTMIGGLPVNKGWWLCKYSINEPRVDFSAATVEQVGFFANLLGLTPEVYGSKILRFKPTMSSLVQAPIFGSIRKWAKAHPRLAARGKSVYSGQWGPLALGMPDS